jgi:hypothetical protein
MDTANLAYKTKKEKYFCIDPSTGKLGAKVDVGGISHIVPWNTETVMRPELVAAFLFEMGWWQDDSTVSIKALKAVENYCFACIAESQSACDCGDPDCEGPTLVELHHLACGFYAGYRTALTLNSIL